MLAGEILKEVRDSVEQGVSAQTIIKGLRNASAMAVNRVKEIAVDMKDAAGGSAKQIETLRRLAGTAMNSKLIKRNSEFFTKSKEKIFVIFTPHLKIMMLILIFFRVLAVVVDAVLSLDQDDLNEKLIGVKKVTGGALQDSLFVNGVAFKKTFSYAGFEQQPKFFKDPKIVCLNVELELKSEKDNAEVRVEHVSEYQAIVDAEWQIIFNKLEALYKTGAKVVLSKLPIGDLATQYYPPFLPIGYPNPYYTFLLTMTVDTLPIVISSVLAECRQTIWNVSTKLRDLPRSLLAPISKSVTLAPAALSRSARSEASDLTYFQSARNPRPAH